MNTSTEWVGCFAVIWGMGSVVELRGEDARENQQASSLGDILGEKYPNTPGSSCEQLGKEMIVTATLSHMTWFGTGQGTRTPIVKFAFELVGSSC
jgi:hypothetical protein